MLSYTVLYETEIKQQKGKYPAYSVEGEAFDRICVSSK